MYDIRLWNAECSFLEKFIDSFSEQSCVNFENEREEKKENKHTQTNK